MKEYVGGYDDWLRQRSAGADAAKASSPAPRADRAVDRADGTTVPGSPAIGAPSSKKKLSYNEQRELSALPDAIARLEAEQQALSAAVAAPDFYKQPAGEIAASLARLDAIGDELLQTYSRWDELDSRG